MSIWEEFAKVDNQIETFWCLLPYLLYRIYHRNEMKMHNKNKKAAHASRSERLGKKFPLSNECTTS